MLPSLVINLDDQPLRWAHVEREFPRIGLAPPRRLAADTGQVVPPGTARWSVDDCLADHWTRGEVGCLLSHMAAWRTLVDEGHEAAAVFEDDVVFGADAGAVLGALTFPAVPTMIKLESTFNPTAVARSPSRRLTDRTSLHVLLGDHRGAGAYALNAGAAKVLLRRLGETPSRADILPFSPRGLRGEVAILQVVPACVIQQEFLPSARRDDRMKSVLAVGRWEKELARQRTMTERLAGRAARTVEGLRLRLASRFGPSIVPFLDIDGELFIYSG